MSARETDAERERHEEEELRHLPNELRGYVRSFYDGELEPSDFVHCIESIRDELERHAGAIEARDEQGDTEDGDTA